MKWKGFRETGVDAKLTPWKETQESKTAMPFPGNQLRDFAQEVEEKGMRPDLGEGEGQA